MSEGIGDHEEALEMNNSEMIRQALRPDMKTDSVQGKPTSTPWSLTMNADIDGDVFIYGPDGNELVIHSAGPLLGLSQANAAFIVRAVNAFELNDKFLDQLEDDLIEQRAQLSKAQPAVGGFEHGVVTGHDHVLGMVIDRLQAHFKAIAKAEGR